MSQRRTRFGLLRDKKTRKPIPKRPKDGTKVYSVQPCRRCGEDVSTARHCACGDRKRHPLKPRPGRVYAAFVDGKTA